MKQIFVLLFLIGFTGLFAQTGDTATKKMKPGLLNNEKSIRQIQQLKESAQQEIQKADTTVIRDDATRNVDAILDWQEEQRARQKKAAIVRIAIGLGFLGLLIFGLMRRRKRK